MSKVFRNLAPTMELLEFLLKNSDDWFTARDISTKLGIDITRAYDYTKRLYDLGFIFRSTRVGYGKSIWVKIDKNAKPTEIVSALYISLKPKV